MAVVLCLQLVLHLQKMVLAERKKPPAEAVIESALSKVAKVDGDDKVESSDEASGNSALCSFFGAKAWTS